MALRCRVGRWRGSTAEEDGPRISRAVAHTVLKSAAISTDPVSSAPPQIPDVRFSLIRLIPHRSPDGLHRRTTHGSNQSIQPQIVPRPRKHPQPVAKPRVITLHGNEARRPARDVPIQAIEVPRAVPSPKVPSPATQEPIDVGDSVSYRSQQLPPGQGLPYFGSGPLHRRVARPACQKHYARIPNRPHLPMVEAKKVESLATFHVDQPRLRFCHLQAQLSRSNTCKAASAS